MKTPDCNNGTFVNNLEHVKHIKTQRKQCENTMLETQIKRKRKNIIKTKTWTMLKTRKQTM